MANYRAIANGNWSNLAIWQDDSLGYFAPSSVLPTTDDNVYANNFTVTIDGTRNAFTIRNTAFIPPTQLALMSIPQMTSNTTPSGVAAASSVQSGFAAWQAFDRNTGNPWTTLTGVNTGWLSYQFPTGRIIKRYGFFSWSLNTFNPRTWTFEGSNNGSSWTILDTQTNFVTGVSTFYSFDISSNTTSYTYYRINVTVNQGGSTVATSELEMSEVTNLYGGIVAGGSFNFNSGSISGSVTSTSPLSAGATNLITVTATTGSVSLALGGNVVPRAITNDILILHSGNCNFNLSGTNFNGITATGANFTSCINKTSAGLITIIGNINGGSTGGSNQGAQSFVSTNGNTIVIGNVVGGGVTGGGNHRAINQSAGTLTITGNVTGGQSVGNNEGVSFSGTSCANNKAIVLCCHKSDKSTV
jgi:hypothetical protein